MKMLEVAWKKLFENLINKDKFLLSWTLNNFLKALALSALRFYKTVISPLLGPSCRFQPTCSEYAIQTFTQYSFLHALYLVFMRLLKCHPLGNFGYDPVPERRKERKNA